MPSPIGHIVQWCDDEDVSDAGVEDMVAVSYQVEHSLVLQNGHHVRRHSLPEVEQEVTNLQETGSSIGFRK